MNELLVIGSINMDFIIQSKKRPLPGETILGEEIEYLPGGKGANQAVAAARMGVKVSFMGCVGDDVFGNELILNFKKNNINTDLIKKVKNKKTGIASINVSGGENSIIVIEGANSEVSIDMIKNNIEKIKKFGIVLIQNEIPIKTVEYIIKICNDNNILVIYNPAPYKEINKKLLDELLLITPNEHEVKQLGCSLTQENILVTRGEQGVEYKSKIYPSIRVNPVDTTGAGDTFNGVLCAMLLERKPIEEAIEIAQKASRKAIMGFGAQSAMPYREDLL